MWLAQQDLAEEDNLLDKVENSEQEDLTTTESTSTIQVMDGPLPFGGLYDCTLFKSLPHSVRQRRHQQTRSKSRGTSK